MPSFDIVSEVDWHEVDNALDQANREISNRYDFKGTDTRVERSEATVTVYAEDEFKITQALDILHNRLAKRGVDLAALEAGEVEEAGAKAKQKINVRSGVDGDTAKQIVKIVKGSKLKVQTSIQGDQVRITGKKRDNLQDVISMLKETEIKLPLQFTNFRD